VVKEKKKGERKKMGKDEKWGNKKNGKVIIFFCKSNCKILH